MGGGVAGVLASHQWDVEGGDRETKITGGQYFYAFPLGGGWQIAAGPTWSYDWVSESLTLSGTLFELSGGAAVKAAGSNLPDSGDLTLDRGRISVAGGGMAL